MHQYITKSSFVFTRAWHVCGASCADVTCFPSVACTIPPLFFSSLLLFPFFPFYGQVFFILLPLFMHYLNIAVFIGRCCFYFLCGNHHLDLEW